MGSQPVKMPHQISLVLWEEINSLFRLSYLFVRMSRVLIISEMGMLLLVTAAKKASLFPHSRATGTKSAPTFLSFFSSRKENRVKADADAQQ